MEDIEKSKRQFKLREWSNKIKRFMELMDAGDNGFEFKELRQWIEQAGKSDKEILESAEYQAIIEREREA